MSDWEKINSEHRLSYEKLGFGIAVEKRRLYFDLSKIFHSDAVSLDDKDNTSHFAVAGFEDILGGKTLGSGVFTNTGISGFNFVQTLACLLPLAQVEDILEESHTGREGAEIIANLRKEKPLNGISIIDLGSGIPNYALALNTLGAEVYTVDADTYSVGVDFEHHLAGVDLNMETAIQTIVQKFKKDNFDLCNESIIAPLAFSPMNLKTPPSQKILELGQSLLKPGGYLVSNEIREMALVKK